MVKKQEELKVNRSRNVSLTTTQKKTGFKEELKKLINLKQKLPLCFFA